MQWSPIEEAEPNGRLALLYDDSFEVPFSVIRMTREEIDGFGVFSNSRWPTHFFYLDDPR